MTQCEQKKRRAKVAQSSERGRAKRFGEKERAPAREEPWSVGTVGKKWQAVFRREATPQHTKVSRAGPSSKLYCVKIF